MFFGVQLVICTCASACVVISTPCHVKLSRFQPNILARFCGPSVLTKTRLCNVQAAATLNELDGLTEDADLTGIEVLKPDIVFTAQVWLSSVDVSMTRAHSQRVSRHVRKLWPWVTKC